MSAPLPIAWPDRIGRAILLGCLGLNLCLPAAASTGRTTSAEPARDLDQPRVIVKYRSSGITAQSATSGSAPVRRAQVLASRHSLNLTDGPTLAPRTQVLQASGVSRDALIARLAADPDVEYVVPDHRRYAQAAPNDPLYAAGQTTTTPTAGQWYLRAPTSTLLAAINAEGAWSLTTGSSDIVVAVLDSGVRFDHPDLSGRLLPGYDFINDTATANDGDGQDSDPSDPGDWITTAESLQRGGTFEGCDVGNSLWHGTQTAGLIGASTGNGIGMAGIGRNVRLLPVRVLGKCGGLDSDILAALRWAAGLHIDGVPDNPTPARIINLSLGSATACTTAYQNVLNELKALGVVVVASAGNEGLAVTSPANCSLYNTAMVAVTGVRHAGTKADYSSLGPAVTVSAPSGNCINLTGACLYPILSTSNSGATTPVSSDNYYTTGGDDYAAGTSFAAPQVAGTLALMLSIKPALGVDALVQALRSSARSFPGSGAGSLSACTTDTSAVQKECYCNTQTCGAGLLDASAAVLAASQSSNSSSSSSSTSSSSSSSSGGDSGGGGLAPGWLAGLALAVLALAGRRRS